MSSDTKIINYNPFIHLDENGYFFYKEDMIPSEYYKTYSDADESLQEFFFGSVN